MSENKKYEYGLQPENAIKMRLMLDRKTGLDCVAIAIFPVEGKDYIVLRPIDDAVGIEFFYRLKETPKGLLELENIIDDDEYNLVTQAYGMLYDK